MRTPRRPDRLQQPHRGEAGDVTGEDRLVEGDPDVGLRAEVVDLVRVDVAQQVDQRHAVVEVAVVQEQPPVRRVRVLVDVVEPLGVEATTSAAPGRAPRSPCSSSSSARYEPSCPVMPVIKADFATRCSPVVAVVGPGSFRVHAAASLRPFSSRGGIDHVDRTARPGCAHVRRGPPRPGRRRRPAALPGRRLHRPGDPHVVASWTCATRAAVEAFFAAERPATVVHGRRQGRRDPGQQHLPGRLPLGQPAHPGQRARRGGTRTASTRLLFLGSSCIYPKLAPQPIREDSLLTGPLEPTNDAYAIAKIAGVLQVQALPPAARRCTTSPRCRPTSTGRATTSTRRTRTCCPALIRRFHEAKLRRRAEVVRLGHRHAAPRVPARRRPGRGLPVPARALRRRRADQRRLRRGPDDPRAGRDWSPTSSASTGALEFDTPSPTARRASCWTSARSTALGLEGRDRPARGPRARPTPGTRSSSAMGHCTARADRCK